MKTRKKEGNIMEDVRYLFKLKKQMDANKFKNVRNPLRLKKENETNKSKIVKDNRNPVEPEQNY